GDGDRLRRQPRRANQDAGQRRLRRRPGRVRQAPREPREQGDGGPLREGRRRGGLVVARIPRRRQCRRRSQGRLRIEGGHVPGGTEGRRVRHDARQGLRRRDQAPPLLLQPRLARQLALAQQPRLHRRGAGPGPRLPRQAHVGPPRRREAHDPAAGGRARRRRTLAHHGEGLDPRSEERRRGRMREREGAGAEEGRQVMELKVINDKGESQSSVAASDTLFGRAYNESLVHQVVVAYHANGRSGTRQQKTRSEVRHSTRKPWRQKGTGRARAGMTSSPLWRGGGRIFPNSPDENFTQKVNRKMYRAGMASIFSQLAREGRLAVVDSLTVDAPKTKLLAQKFKAMGLDSVLVIADQVDDNLLLASRNLANVLVVEPRYADPLSLVFYKKVLVTKRAIEQLKEMLS